MKKLFILAFVFSLIVYYLTSAGKTPYDYFTRLSSSFLQGKYYLSENPHWLSELVPGPGGRFYVIQPPMPAILSFPFVYFFGKNFEQQYLAHILGAGIIILTMAISYKLKKSYPLAIFFGIMIGFGSIVWYLSATGSVWYLGQVSAAFLTTAALYESLNKRRSFLIGIFLGSAFLSRLHTILSLPLFLYLLANKDWFKKYFYLGLGILPFVLFNFYYNFIRFGTVLDKGYFLIPGIYSEPWFSKGMLNIAYIPEHLKILFLKLPNFFNHPPYIQPSWYGLAIWITTPVFIFAFWSPIKENLTKMLWLAVILIFILVALRGGTGWTQFGYRYAVDFYPFLTLLTIKGIEKVGLKKYHWILLFIGVVVNLWGVIWINKFGWVSF
ncbi:MAG: hypothetical protein AAB535_02330 [Patescibacteria group bacterium]